MSFEEFWFFFPRRTAKFQARTAYDRAIKIATHEEILEGVRQYAKERQGEPQKYTKHPATWLNGGCWMDHQAVEPPALVATQPKIFKCPECLQITLGTECAHCRRDACGGASATNLIRRSSQG